MTNRRNPSCISLTQNSFSDDPVIQRHKFIVTDPRVLLLETICVSPASFLGLCSMGDPGSGAQRRRTGRVPCCKGLKKTRGESMLEEEAPCDRLQLIDAGGHIANPQFQDTIYYKIINPDYAL
ncbi:MAG: hypothetical protein C4B57_09650 [Deltaproteobacteria bacterium]|nr:MAG: hypothetical protein C4B57_09650 [Deltaproteobacteria bacterium]